MTHRRRLYRAIEPSGRWTPINVVLALVIIASISVAVLETEPGMAWARRGFMASDLAFTAVFLVEYAARLWVAPEDPRYAEPLSGRLRWMRSPTAIVDLAALAPALLVMGPTPAYLLRLLRLLRIVRLARYGRFSRAWSLMAEALVSRRHELLVALFVGLMALLVAATLMYLVEGEVQPDKFGSIPRSLWWAVVTLTTIGYGDVFPVTPLGKLLAGVTAVIGIGLIAAPTGILAAAFSEAMQRHREALELDTRGAVSPDADPARGVPR